MNNFLMDVLDLKVFDESGKSVTKLNKATEGKLVHNEKVGSYFAINIVNFDINIVNFDIDLIKAIGEVVKDDNLSDFEKELTPRTTKIKFKSAYSSKSIKKFKLIAEGNLYNEEHEVSHTFRLLINNASLTSGFNMDANNSSISEFTHVFRIDVDDNGDSFELELEEK